MPASAPFFERLLAGLDALLGAFSPTPCAGCGADGPVCRGCREELARLPGLLRMPDDTWIPLAAGSRLPVEAGEQLCLGPYQGLLAKLSRAAKRRGSAPALHAMAEALWQRVQATRPAFFAGLQAITCPPPAPERRHDHPAIRLAEFLAARTGLPFFPGLAVRSPEVTGKTRYLGREARPHHVARLFLGGRPLPAGVARVLLVDDLTTSGATVRHLATLLARRGAREVRVLTCAQTPMQALARVRGSGPARRVIRAMRAAKRNFSIPPIAQDHRTRVGLTLDGLPRSW